MNRFISLLLSLVVLIITSSSTTTTVQAFSNAGLLPKSRPVSTTTTSQNMFSAPMMDVVSSSSSFGVDITDSSSMLLGAVPMAQAVAKNVFKPDFESEIFTDLSHVVSDFSAFFRPKKSTMKMYSVVGRILCLAADYVPDHVVHTEELAVQLFLIGVGVTEMIQRKVRYDMLTTSKVTV